MRRALVLLAALLLGGAVGAGRVSALSAAVVSCEHLHLAYSFISPPVSDTAYPLAVSSSACGADTAVSGGGSITFPASCLSSIGVVCGRVALNLSDGADPAFSTTGALYYPVAASPVPASTLDFATAEALTDFSPGAGSGALNTLCTFNNPIESCTADGAFSWTP